MGLFAADSDLVFTSHHWPVWSVDEVRRYLSKQRDMYKYLHDQTLRLADHGLTPTEIAEDFELPPSLAEEWYNRSYYGSVSHNSRAVYQRYLGFFDGNPAHLHPLPPQDAGARYVELAGGAEALLEKARDAFDHGEYRWVAQLVDHLVFSDPANAAARELEADALEQLGYQTENATWRNFYLTGAQELRGWRPADGTTGGRMAGGGMLGGWPGVRVRLSSGAAERSGRRGQNAGREPTHHRYRRGGRGASGELCPAWHRRPSGRRGGDDPVSRALGAQRPGGRWRRPGRRDRIGPGERRGRGGRGGGGGCLFGMLDVFDRWFAVVTP